MIRRCFTRTNRGILDQDTVLAGYLLQLVKEGGSFRGILERWLMLPDPLVAFHPKISFFYLERLLGQRRFACGELAACATQRAKDPVQNQKIHKHEQRAAHNPCKHTLEWISSLIPRRHHRGLPSNRNCAWSFGKMRGAAILN